ncbi:MAG: methyltransferase domain-containing protein [Nitrospirae bacterium]|nr:methyltransferase domain-containing protein [Nitrospirota bacterium]
MSGIVHRWFDDFSRYWSNVLHGRPFWSVLDFFLLLHDYRKRQQHVAPLEWGDPARHLANWQHPSQIYATLHGVRHLALHPVECLELWHRVAPGTRILEYGCSFAPFYSCYIEFFSHLDCHWVLADIPGFPFHYAKYLYRNDAQVDFITINEGDFQNPLGGGDFDVIILTTVLEHLDNPLFVSRYLLKKLKPGGLFIFDYIKSDGIGLDHPKALELREDCLNAILEETRIVFGRIDDINKSVGLCIAEKNKH